ncbi:hypothetical protein F4778DRAFT_525244 [Xylariomycetidae sp. FL2044]|nr:hypothetical protein F4778DRAFT_525244 [Xylariomycetidae sp. FL2044]
MQLAGSKLPRFATFTTWNLTTSSTCRHRRMPQSIRLAEAVLGNIYFQFASRNMKLFDPLRLGCYQSQRSYLDGVGSHPHVCSSLWLWFTHAGGLPIQSSSQHRSSKAVEGRALGPEHRDVGTHWIRHQIKALQKSRSSGFAAYSRHSKVKVKSASRRLRSRGHATNTNQTFGVSRIACHMRIRASAIYLTDACRRLRALYEYEKSDRSEFWVETREFFPA